MNIILTSITSKNYTEISDLTFPLMEKYAKIHGYDFATETVEPVDRPASWYKIPWLLKLLEQYDAVICLDADCVIVNGKEDILEGVDAIQSLVFHNTDEGEVPNCGAWILSPKMIDVLNQMWEQTDLINHKWWENAALLRLMGYNLLARVLPGNNIKNELRDATGRLDGKWNVLRSDLRKDACIRHAAGELERPSLVKVWREEADKRWFDEGLIEPVEIGDLEC